MRQDDLFYRLFSQSLLGPCPSPDCPSSPVFDINTGSQGYRLEFRDTSSPENWRLLDPNVIVICYDVSQRLSLINMKRYVRRLGPSRWVDC